MIELNCTGTQDANEGLQEEAMVDENDKADLVPLVQLIASSNIHQQYPRCSFETEKVDVSMDDGTIVFKPRSCCSLHAALAVSVFLLMLPVAAFLIWSMINYDGSPHHAQEYPLHDVCESNYNETFDELVIRVELPATSLCRPSKPNCACPSTVRPLPHRWPGPPESKQRTYLNYRWDLTFKRNKELAKSTTEFDVVLLGDSITEHWMGTDLAIPDVMWKPSRHIFQSLFHKSSGGKVDGLALGIGGDLCGTLLYRLLNGELPDTLSTKVIWILIGTNDFGASHCSSESIAAGSIRIVQYIQIQRPDVKIVLNSILPRGKDGNLFASPGGWEELDELHHRLECFAKVTRNVEFFNATSMFLLDDGENQNPDYFEDPVHPSAAGHQVWGQAIVETVLELTRGHGN